MNHQTSSSKNGGRGNLTSNSLCLRETRKKAPKPVRENESEEGWREKTPYTFG